MRISEVLPTLSSVSIRRKSWPASAYVVHLSSGFWWTNDCFRAMFYDAKDVGLTTEISYMPFLNAQLDENDWEKYEHPITAEKIANMLGCNSTSPVSVNKGTFSAPNISWGFFRWGEVDYLQISKSMYLTEVEIKVSYTDFKKDRSKTKFKNPRYFALWQKQIHNFYYAAPSSLAEQILPEIDPNYGVISAGFNCFGTPELKVLRKSKKNDKAQPITTDDLIKLSRLLSFRLFKEKQ